jgi:hypothetical protein
MAYNYKDGNYVAVITKHELRSDEKGISLVIDVQPTYRFTKFDDPSTHENVPDDAPVRSLFFNLTGIDSEKAKKVISDLKEIGFVGCTSIQQFDLRNENHIDMRGTHIKVWAKGYTNQSGQQKQAWYFSPEKAVRTSAPPDEVSVAKLDALFGDLLEKPVQPVSTASAPAAW